MSCFPQRTKSAAKPKKLSQVAKIRGKLGRAPKRGEGNLVVTATNTIFIQHNCEKFSEHLQAFSVTVLAFGAIKRDSRSFSTILDIF